MSVSNIGLQSALTFSQLGISNSGFAAASMTDSAQWTLTGLTLTSASQMYAQDLTITSGASTTINLTTVPDNVGDTFSFSHVYGIWIQPVGSDVTIGPSATSGISWFFNGSTPSNLVRNNGLFVHADQASTSGQSVTGGASNLTITNTGGTETIVTTIIWGSTV